MSLPLHRMVQDLQRHRRAVEFKRSPGNLLRVVGGHVAGRPRVEHLLSFLRRGRCKELVQVHPGHDALGFDLEVGRYLPAGCQKQYQKQHAARQVRFYVFTESAQHIV